VILMCCGCGTLNRAETGMGQTLHIMQGTLRASDAAAVAEALAKALSQGDLQIETQDLTAVDGAVLQVLLSAGQSAAQLERKLHITFPEGGALSVMRDRLALGDAFGTGAKDVATA
jgi:ABC-type transporter Mla MlaB component